MSFQGDDDAVGCTLIWISPPVDHKEPYRTGSSNSVVPSVDFIKTLSVIITF